MAYIPVDLSPFAATLRDALEEGGPAHAYALAALNHAARTGRARTMRAFLPDLHASYVIQRRVAAVGLKQVAVLLWSGEFGWSVPLPFPDWWNDSRLCTVPYPAGGSPQVTDKLREQEAETAQTQLLAALNSAVDDADLEVSRDAGLSLEEIGKQSDATLGFGGRARESARIAPSVIAALTRASRSLLTRDPASSLRLNEIILRLTGPRSVF